MTRDTTKRTPWTTLVGVFVVVSAVLGLVSNAGGARDAACSLPGFHDTCVEIGAIRPEAPTVEYLQAQTVEGLNGRWGRLDRACADTVTYQAEQGEAGVWRIYATAQGFESTMQVTAIDTTTSVITARGFAPNENGVRELWEFRPEGDVLALRDPTGTETVLARCAG